MFREYYLRRDDDRPLLDRYRDLASQFPRGLAEVSELPEEASGAVKAAWGGRARRIER
jgi:hypothetical protein